MAPQSLVMYASVATPPIRTTSPKVYRQFISVSIICSVVIIPAVR